MPSSRTTSVRKPLAVSVRLHVDASKFRAWFIDEHTTSRRRSRGLLTKSGGSLGAARPSSRQILLVADFIRQQTKEDRAANRDFSRLPRFSRVATPIHD